jgi:predicted glycosyltransferase
MMTGCAFPPFYSLPYGMDFVKLPSIIKLDTNSWSARTLPIKFEAFKNIRTSILRNTAHIFKPDILLVDYVPTGVWGELLPTLELLKKRTNPPKIIFGLRDIVDEPEKVCSLWSAEGVYDVLEAYYDRIFIYGSEDVYNTAVKYGLNGKLKEKVVYCGYLCNDSKFGSQQKLRKKLGLNEDKVILVTGGGGYDAFPFMELALKAIHHLIGKLSLEAVFITGPLMREENHKKIEILAEELPVKVIKSCDTSDYIQSADVVLTMAGYNSLMDSLSFSKDIIVVPRENASKEQRIRANLFDRLDLITALDPVTRLSSRNLADEMAAKLGGSSKNPVSINTNGLDNVMNELKNLFPDYHKESGMNSGETIRSNPVQLSTNP